MRNSSIEKDRSVIKSGVELLIAHCAYSQAAIHRKLVFLDCKIAPASFNNIINDKPIGAPLARTVRTAIEQLVAKELGLQWDAGVGSFQQLNQGSSWQAVVVPEHAKGDATPHLSFLRPEGRLTILDKVKLINQAQQEVVEFGLRLRSFSNYFLTRSAHEFKSHIIAQLEKGVNFKFYLLDPDCNEARMYFEDRSRIFPEDREGQEKARASAAILTQLKEELNVESLPGDFNVFYYKHVPTAHFLIVDGSAVAGLMAYTPYLYGIRRADCPVAIINRKEHRQLFRVYYQSYLALSKEAVHVI